MTEQLDDIKHPDGPLNDVASRMQTSKSFGPTSRDHVLSLLDDEN